MIRWLYTVLLLSLLPDFYCQDVQRFVKNISEGNDTVSIYYLADFYFNDCKNLEQADSISKDVSNYLKEKNSQRAYFLNEIEKVQINTELSRPVEAFEIADLLQNEIKDFNDAYLNAYLLEHRGGVYFSINDALGALDCYMRSTSNFESSNDLKGLKGNYINIGNCHGATGNFEKAEVYYDSASSLFQQGVDAFQQNLLLNESILFLSTNRYAECITNSEKVLAKLEKSDHERRSSCHLTIGEAYLSLDEIEIAKSYALLSLKEIERGRIEHLQKYVYGFLSDLYEKSEQFDSAHFYQKLVTSSIEERGEANLSRQIARVGLQHTVELYEKEKKVSALQIVNKRKENVILMNLVLFLMIISSFLLWINWKIKRKNKSLMGHNLSMSKIPIESLNNRGSDRSDQITEEESQLIERLEEAVYSKEIYKNSNLSLESLSKKLGTNRSYLSSAINKNYKLNYSAWINKIRVEASRVQLASPEFDKYSIEGISQNVGFRSISTFNTSFKKVTGLTPSYFRDKARSEG